METLPPAAAPEVLSAIRSVESDRERFLFWVDFPEAARVLEAGCGSGGLVNDRWLVRRLPPLVTSCGFQIERLDSHGYLQTAAPDYMLTLADRGADILANSKRIDPALADGLKKEARRRADNGEFFGFIAFASLIACKPV